MKEYIKNILPRLIQFSESLDKKEVFVDSPWVWVDENSNQQKYIFKRNGELIMSLNGIVSIGKWEYLSVAKSLLIDRIQDKILLNQHFIDNTVMILKKDGFKEENVILANEVLLPNLDVVKYLKMMFYRVNSIHSFKLENGKYLEIHNFYGNFYENKVSIEGNSVSDGIFEIIEENNKKKLIIKNNKISKVIVKKSFYTNKGEIFIELDSTQNPKKGDFVFQYDKPAPDGNYRLSYFWNIFVENGQIIKD